MRGVERDPLGIPAGDPGAKLDDGKIRAALLKDMGLALMAVAELLTLGAEKYSESGWVSVPNGKERYDDAMARHWLRNGYEEMDSDMVIRHEVSVAWNALTRLEKLIRSDEEWRRRLLAGRVRGVGSQPATPESAALE